MRDAGVEVIPTVKVISEGRPLLFNRTLAHSSFRLPPSVFPERRSPLFRRALALGFFALLLPGCAQNRDWMIRKEGVESTIGHDPNKEPAGKVIPPAGMGVDLSSLRPDDRGSLLA